MDANNGSSPQVIGYSVFIAYIYVFNLMVGVGVLAFPKVFAETGWILGLLALSVLSVISYLTSTLIIEAMAISNAVLRLSKKENRAKFVTHSEKITSSEFNEEKITSSEFNEEEIGVQEFENVVANNDAVDSSCHCDNTDGKRNTDTKVTNNDVIENSYHADGIEVRAKTFMSVTNNGVVDKPYKNEDTKMEPNTFELTTNSKLQVIDDCDLFNITVKMEMGDLSKLFFNKAGVVSYYIIICLYLYGGLSIYVSAIAKSLTTMVCGDSNCFSHNQSWPCQNVKILNVMQMYRIMITCFAVTICPFVFFNVTKTKFLQILTTIFRWIAISSMVVLAVIKIRQGKGNHSPNSFEFSAFPDYFGVCVYAVLMQHTIPGLITPIINKKRIYLMLMFAYISASMVMILLGMTATFAFSVEDIQDLYTLNFSYPTVFRYMLEVYPVCILSTNFPVLAIVLRENLKTLFLTKGENNYGIFLRRILFPTMVVIIPVVLSYITYDVGALVGYTGAYAGSLLEYIIPVMLVYFGRKNIAKILGTEVYDNKYRSPFRHRFWILFVLVCYLSAFIFVTYSKITKFL